METLEPQDRPEVYVAMNRTIDPLIAYIRASAVHYTTYLKWIEGPTGTRGYFMHIDRRDWELAAALYRMKQRKAMGIAL